MKLTNAMLGLILSLFLVVAVSAQGQTGQRGMMSQQAPDDSTEGQGRMGYGPGMMGYGQGMRGNGQGMMGYGPGMMGYGQGMMGYGQGMMGYGQGMMGYGPGMMGYGPGMMGFGPGMMGYGGMYPGMMGYGGMYPGMMGDDGMGDGMRDGPAALFDAMATIYALPEMKTRLNLTDQEVSQLDNLKSGYLKQRIDWKASIQKSMIDLEQSVKDQAATKQINQSLQDIADTWVNMCSGAYDTYQKMLAVLTPDQQKELESMDLNEKWQRGNRWRGSQHQRNW